MADRPLTFDPAFGKLGREIARFANHTKKLVQASQKVRPVLERASDWTQGTAPLDRRPSSAAAAMRAIDKFARIHREDRANLFGAYFAHHHLRMQAEMSRELLRESYDSDTKARIAAAHKIHEKAVADRREWISALLECSIHAAAPELATEDYVAFNVGALTDHEDVDLGVVVASVEARDHFARAFGTVSKTFLRFASKIQLFLTEQLQTPRTGGMVEEYEEIVRRPIRSVVVVMQLLGAQHLAGSRRLARAFEERITNRYYAESGDPLAHEGFLRSVMNELRHHHNLERISEVLAPKREIYIPSKLVTTAMRAIHGVREAQPAAALKEIAERHAARTASYLTLADAFVQAEVLRGLMFLYVSKADEIDLYDPDIIEASRRVAVVLGLGRSSKGAETRLLATYQDIRARALSSIFELSFDISKHLKKVSTFRGLIERGRALSPTTSNFALRLVHALKRYKGGVFWDEVVEMLAGNKDLGERLLNDLAALALEQRHQVARELVRMMCVDARALVELLVFAAGPHEAVAVAGTESNGALFWDALLDVLSTDSALLGSFVSRLDDEPEAEALFRLAKSHPPSRIAALTELIDANDKSPRGQRVARSLRSMIILVHHHSNALGRVADRVLARTPEFVERLGDFERLRAIARDFVTRAARETDTVHQIDLLGDAWDIEALRTGLMAILEGSPAERDQEFVLAFDVYARELLKACFQQVHSRSPAYEAYRPGTGIALFATGGFGRGEAFGADWDYLAVVDDDDPSRKMFFGKVLQRLEAAMVRRGMIPHNRLTDRFNSYVVSIQDMRAYLMSRGPEAFIDEAEVLEARFVAGDQLVRRRFVAEIAEELVERANGPAFIRDLLRELRAARETPPVGLDLKLGAGGLRELHLLFLMLRIHAKLPGQFGPALLHEAVKALPDHGADLRFLLVANSELRRIRDLYRLVVAIDDPVEPEPFIAIARDLAPLRDAGAREDFAQSTRKLMQAAALRVDRVVSAIGST